MTETPVRHQDDAAVLAYLRNELCQALRQHLLGLGALEVATPVLQRVPDVAPTRQFTTSHPATGERSYLRIAPTENLKRLMAAGLSHVFEFAVNFREDVADTTHLPEFTSLEVMARDACCRDMERLATELCQLAFQTAKRTVPSSRLPAWLHPALRQGAVPVQRVALDGELDRRFGVSRAGVFGADELRRVLNRLGDRDAGGGESDLGSLTDRVVTLLAADIGGAVLVTGFPEYLGGPAEPDAAHHGFKQRSELFIDGIEIANMSGNLTDSAALRRWHERGVGLKTQRGIATNHLDERLLADLAGRLPTSAVIGVGVERLLMTFFGVSDVRDLRQIY
jgi:lysyl-tRNA synthetase class 2